MSQYYECPKCHAHLDSVSERCDCERVANAQRSAPSRNAGQCPHFMQRYDMGLRSGITCRFGIDGRKVTVDNEIRNKLIRDEYYARHCCGQFGECPIYAGMDGVTERTR